MKTNAQIRRQARDALRGNWGIFVLIILLSIVIQTVAGTIFASGAKTLTGDPQQNLVDFLLKIFVFFAISYSLYFMALLLVRQHRIRPGLLGMVFTRELYLPMLLINLLSMVVNYLLGIIIFVPIFLMSGFDVYRQLVMSSATNYTSIPFSSTGFWILLPILLIVYLFLTEVITGVFQFAAWVKLDHPEYTVREAVGHGWRLIRPRMGQYVLLQLSFVGWMLLGMLAFFVGMLWVMAYLYVANAAFYEAAVHAETSA